MRAKRWTMSLTAIRSAFASVGRFGEAGQYTGAQCNGSICCRINRRCACSKKSCQSVPARKQSAGAWRSLRISIFKDTSRKTLSCPPIILIEMVAQVGGLAVGAPGRRRGATPAAVSRGRNWSVQISRGGEAWRAPRSIGSRGRQPWRSLQDRGQQSPLTAMVVAAGSLTLAG